jgi:hypothetical protein
MLIGTPKADAGCFSQCSPADGMNAANKNQDFGTSRLAALG